VKKAVRLFLQSEDIAVKQHSDTARGRILALLNIYLPKTEFDQIADEVWRARLGR